MLSCPFFMSFLWLTLELLVHLSFISFFYRSCSSCTSLPMSRPINQKGELPRANTLKHSRSHNQYKQLYQQQRHCVRQQNKQTHNIRLRSVAAVSQLMEFLYTPIQVFGEQVWFVLPLASLCSQLSLVVNFISVTEQIVKPFRLCFFCWAFPVNQERALLLMQNKACYCQTNKTENEQKAFQGKNMCNLCFRLCVFWCLCCRYVRSVWG